MSVAPILSRCRDEGRAALVGYLPVGFPSVEGSIEALTALVDAGVDILEVGVPYSDPVIDGPVIQDAAVRALAGGTQVDDVFRAVRAVTEHGGTALVMTYWNLVRHRGVERFARDLADAGGAGLITPDLIPDEAQEWLAASDAHDLDRVFLVAPSSTPERLAHVTASCRGFVYATAVMGVTGARETVGTDAAGLVARVREASSLPVGVGLGVSTGAQAREIAQYADAVIVGSALVRCLTEAPDDATGLQRMRTLADELVAAVRAGRSGGPRGNGGAGGTGRPGGTG